MVEQGDKTPCPFIIKNERKNNNTDNKKYS